MNEAVLQLVPQLAPKSWGEELWLDSVRPEYPAGLKGGGTLAQLLRRRPELLGARSRLLFGESLPVFSKLLRTDFPPRAHLGFKTAVKAEDFAAWAGAEQTLLRRLLKDLRVPDRRAFAAFDRSYRLWAMDRALRGWKPQPARDHRFLKDLQPCVRTAAPDLASLVAGLCANRARIAGVFNEVDLDRERGNLLLLKAGLVHGLFGLSLQFHPRAHGPGLEPKSEAWLPLAEVGYSLAEVQQSSDSTHSLADFFTPFCWEKGARFRKGDPEGGIDDKTLKHLVSAMDSSVTRPGDLRRRPQPQDPGPASQHCRMFSLVDEARRWPGFSLRRLELDGSRRAPAGYTGFPPEGAFEQVVGLCGCGRLAAAGEDCPVGPQEPVFIPATLPGRYSIVSDQPAAFLLISIPA